MTSHLKLVVVSLSLLSLVISAINGSGKNNNGNNNDNVIKNNNKLNNNNDNNDFQLLKISYNDIQDKLSRQNVIDVLKSSLSRDGNDNKLLYLYIFSYIEYYFKYVCIYLTVMNSVRYYIIVITHHHHHFYYYRSDLHHH